MKVVALRIAVALTLLTAVFAQTQLGCQLTQDKCSGNGVCEVNGYCTCYPNFLGESCQTAAKKTLKKGALGKGFITFWVLFWILLNCLLPLIIFAIVKYAQDKDCSDINSLLRDVCEAACCCFVGEKQARRRPDSVPIPKGVSLLEEVKDEPVNEELKLAEPSKNSPSQIELEKLQSSQPPENAGVVKLPSIHPKPSKVVYSYGDQNNQPELQAGVPQVFDLFRSDDLQMAEFEGIIKYKFKTHNSIERDLKDMLKTIGVDDLLNDQSKKLAETLADLEKKLNLPADKKLTDSNLFANLNTK